MHRVAWESAISSGENKTNERISRSIKQATKNGQPAVERTVTANCAVPPLTFCGVRRKRAIGDAEMPVSSFVSVARLVSLVGAGSLVLQIGCGDSKMKDASPPERTPTLAVQPKRPVQKPRNI